MNVYPFLTCGWLVCVLLSGTACSSSRSGREVAVAKDAYYQRITISALAAYDRGDLDRAADLHAQALQRARAMDRASEISASAYHLGLAQAGLGLWSDARVSFAESMLEADRAGESRYEAWIADAETAWRAGQSSDAWASTEAMLVALEGIRMPAWLSQIHTLRALMAIQEGKVEQARESVRVARDLLTTSKNARLLARLLQAEGQLLMAEASPVLAANAFDREAQMYRNAALFYDMAVALSRAGTAYAKGDDPQLAADRHFRAARSFHAMGHTVPALQQMESALHVLETFDDPVLTGRIAQLFSDIQLSVKKNEP